MGITRHYQGDVFSSMNWLDIYQHTAFGNTIYSKPYFNEIIDTLAVGRDLSGNMDSSLRNMTGFPDI